MSAGQKLFQAMHDECNMRCEACDELYKAVGLEVDDLNAPFNDITFDSYDCSFEFKDCLLGWKPTNEQIKACIELGFLRCWICYTDGSEWYYGKESGWYYKPRKEVSNGPVS